MLQPCVWQSVCKFKPPTQTGHASQLHNAHAISCKQHHMPCNEGLFGKQSRAVGSRYLDCGSKVCQSSPQGTTCCTSGNACNKGRGRQALTDSPCCSASHIHRMNGSQAHQIPHNTVQAGARQASQPDICTCQSPGNFQHTTCNQLSLNLVADCISYRAHPRQMLKARCSQTASRARGAKVHALSRREGIQCQPPQCRPPFSK